MRSQGPLANFADPPGKTLRLFSQIRPDATAIRWRINGFQARLLVWTEDEWEQLEARPSDAQFHPSGIWCALRLE